MGKILTHLTDEMQQFIQKQQMFLVATAPLSDEGHINMSPKGLDCFRILGENRVGYLDLTGSGNETSAHIAENGRITFMFCAFNGPANIVRLYGTGKTILPDDPSWSELEPHFPTYTGTRQIIMADIHRVSTSCGYGVPLYYYRGQRETLTKYWEQKKDTVSDYQQQKNSHSIDGLKAPINRIADSNEA